MKEKRKKKRANRANRLSEGKGAIIKELPSFQRLNKDWRSLDAIERSALIGDILKSVGAIGCGRVLARLLKRHVKAEGTIRLYDQVDQLSADDKDQIRHGKGMRAVLKESAARGNSQSRKAEVQAARTPERSSQPERPRVVPQEQEVPLRDSTSAAQEAVDPETLEKTLEDIISYCKDRVQTAGAARSLLRSVRMGLEGTSAKATYDVAIEKQLIDQFSPRIPDRNLLLSILRKADQVFATSEGYWTKRWPPPRIPKAMPDPDIDQSKKRQEERKRQIDQMRPPDHPVRLAKKH